METIKARIDRFISSGSGSGSGDGSGSGSGYGDGSGSGSGSGYGSGYGYGDGSGYGYGDGSGSGSGYGYGSGSGSGYGDGSGSGSGYGYGSGSGSGIKTFDGHQVYIIDGTQTLIDNVHGNVAKGHILRSDLTLVPCFIVKRDNLFAHGETLHGAYVALQDKLFEAYPEDVRIAKFKEQYPDFDKKVPAMELFVWHNRLTGSCEMGRRSFAYDHNINLDNDWFTVNEFIRLTENAYGGSIIKKLRDGN